MRNLLLCLILLMGTSLMYSNDLNDKNPRDKVFSFEIMPAATSGFITIVTNIPKQSVLVKIIDKAGLIRVQKELHLERDLDVSELRNGHYLMKIYADNDMAVKRFYKGKDAVNNR